MKIYGFDLHGTLDYWPSFYRHMLKGHVKDGKLVYIISGPPSGQIKRELIKIGFIRFVHYHDIISVVDYLKSKGIKMWLNEKGGWQCSEEEWWASKAQICQEYNVDILVDDGVKYKEYFDGIKTKFLLVGGE